MKKTTILLLLVILPLTVLCQSIRRDSLKVYLNKAQLLIRDGNKEEANEIYGRIMSEYPDNRNAVQGWLIANMKRSPTGEKDAIGQLDSLLRHYPSNTGILFFKIFLEAEYSMNKEALEDANKLIAMQPDSSDNWVVKGQLLYDMKNFAAATEAFDKAIILNPKRADLPGMKAVSLAQTGRFDEAISVIDKGIDLAPGNPTNFYNRACINSLKGDKEKALTDLKKAIEIQPSFKKNAPKDEDFKSLWEDQDFKELTK